MRTFHPTDMMLKHVHASVVNPNVIPILKRANPLSRKTIPSVLSGNDGVGFVRICQAQGDVAR
jgi:hypothetical protein